MKSNRKAEENNNNKKKSNQKGALKRDNWICRYKSIFCFGKLGLQKFHILKVFLKHPISSSCSSIILICMSVLLRQMEIKITIFDNIYAKI